MRSKQVSSVDRSTLNRRPSGPEQLVRFSILVFVLTWGSVCYVCTVLCSLHIILP